MPNPDRREEIERNFCKAVLKHATSTDQITAIMVTYLELRDAITESRGGEKETNKAGVERIAGIIMRNTPGSSNRIEAHYEAARQVIDAVKAPPGWWSDWIKRGEELFKEAEEAGP